MSERLPVVFLAFANSADDHLAMLKDESREVFRALQGLQQQNGLRIHREESSGVAELYEDLLAYDQDVVVFHYAGHADGARLHLEEGAGSAQGLAKLLGQQSGLKLVFLNGCATKDQVNQLHAAGVPAVIATSVKINDDKATHFATAFYQSLAQGHSIQEAFDSASAYLEARFDADDPNRPSFKRFIAWEDEEETAEEEQGFEWALYVRKDAAEEVKTWRLPDARDQWLTQLHDRTGPIADSQGKPLLVEHRELTRTLDVMQCEACGHALHSLTAGDNCAVCGSNKLRAATLKAALPEAVVPNVLTEAQVRDELTELARRNGLELLALQLVYVPFWRLQVQRQCRFSGERGIAASLDSGTPQLEWQQCNGVVRQSLVDYLAPAAQTPAGRSDASQWDFSAVQLKRKLPDGIRSMPMTEALAAGFSSACEFLDRDLSGEVRERIGGMQQRSVSTECHYQQVEAQSVLLPYWHATLESAEGLSALVVNGQSGAVQVAQIAGLQTLDSLDDGTMNLHLKNEAPKTSLAVSVYSGVGIGIMVGLLLGMAADAGPNVKTTVSIFIGAVGVGLAALLGLNDKHFSTAKGLRIGSFGLAVAVSALSGVYIRDHGVLSPSIGDKVKTVAEATGLDKGQAARVLLGKAAGSASGESAVQFDSRAVRMAGVSALFNSEVDLDACAELRSPYEAEHSAAQMLDNFRLSGGEGWAEFADQVAESIPADQQKSVLQLGRNAMCAQDSFSQSLSATDEQCAAMHMLLAEEPADAGALSVAAPAPFQPLIRQAAITLSEKNLPAGLAVLTQLPCVSGERG